LRRYSQREHKCIQQQVVSCPLNRGRSDARHPRTYRRRFLCHAKIVERSLRQAGVNLTQVLEAGNGAEALAVLEQSQVDLILCDINMPIMDGLEFVKQLAGVSNAKGVPVVMITTEGSESHVVQALSCGARGYIRKPFTADQVKEHVLPVLTVKT